MSYRAWAYTWGILLFGLYLALSALTAFKPSAVDWAPFLVLTLLAAVAQLFMTEAPRHQLYSVTLVFVFAGMFLLDPFLFVLLVTLSHSAGWLKERLTHYPYLREWYLQPFNMAIHLIAGFIARSSFQLIGGNTSSFDSELTVIAIAIAVVSYLAINHVGVGIAITLGRHISFRNSGVLAPDNLLMDTILLVLGATISVLWTMHPFLLLLALAPLVLFYQVLKIPQLKKEAFTDEKTGLWNSRHFGKLLLAETERARRFNRPLAFIMADLDLLRNINNTYGHLAGDAVLSGIGQIIRNNLRDYDVAARFGGEEFSIALPETDLIQARAIAERIREAVQATYFETLTCPTPIRATMSFGVACFMQDASTPNGLIHEADIAVYQAKLRGRNCVVCSSEIPESMRLDNLPVEDRIEHLFVPTFIPRPETVGEHAKFSAPTRLPASTAPEPNWVTHKRGVVGLWFPMFLMAITASGLGWALFAVAGAENAHLIGVILVVSLAVITLVILYKQKHYVEQTEKSNTELGRMNQELELANRQLKAASETVHTLNNGLFHTLANMIDARNPYISGHSNKVADYATALAAEMGLPPHRVARLRQAALLHDIGKIGISDHVLGKSCRLNESEYEYVKTHAALGAHFIETCPGLRSLAPFIRHHHEWWNGTGYPARLQMDRIPLEARILAICDAVEAMASRRPYRRALWLDEIIAEVKRCAGTQFDPQMVDVFVRMLEREGEAFVENSTPGQEVESAMMGATVSTPC